VALAAGIEDGPDPAAQQPEVDGGGPLRCVDSSFMTVSSCRSVEAVGLMKRRSNCSVATLSQPSSCVNGGSLDRRVAVGPGVALLQGTGDLEEEVLLPGGGDDLDADR